MSIQNWHKITYYYNIILIPKKSEVNKLKTYNKQSNKLSIAIVFDVLLNTTNKHI